VVLHRQPAGQSSLPEIIGLAHVEQDCGAIPGKHLPQAGKPDLARATEGAPYGDSELIPHHVREAGGQELVGQALALPAER